MEKKHTSKNLLMSAATGFLIVLSIFAIVAMFVINKESNRGDENTISVTGKAEVDATPDIASFSFSVQETAKTTEAAQEVISEKVDTILKGLKEVGIAEKDIKTQSYTMSPKYEWVRVDQKQQDVGIDGTVYFPGNDRKQVQVGFDVRQNVEVKVRNFDMVPATLSLLGNTGVQDLQGPNFEIDKPDALEEKARAEAIKDAKEKAQRLAKDLDVRIGKVVSFSENDGGYYPQPYYAKNMMARQDSADGSAPAPQLPTGENTISSEVTIIYSIK